MLRYCFLTVLFALFSVAVPAQAAEEYTIGEGDVLRIAVYDHPDLTTVVRVGGDGMISFPLIGQVKVSALTGSSIAEIMAARLADGYLVNPQVSVFVEEFRGSKTTIMGKVVRPGLYELKGRTTFLELLSKAGGLSADAGDRAFVKRKPPVPGTEGDIIVIDLVRLVEKGDMALDVAIQDGDSVFIGAAGIFYITGEVKRPDAYKLEGTMTAIKAITMAGGFTDLAARDKVVVVRDSGTGEETLEVGSGGAPWDTPIRKGDSIFVPKAGVFYVTGEVKNPGASNFEQGSTVLKAVTLAGGFTDRASDGRIRIIRKKGDKEQTIKGVRMDDPVYPDDVIVVPESFF